MRTPSLHRILALAVTVILTGALAPAAQARVVSQFPTLAAPTISYALHAQGEVVRSEDGLRVTRIDLAGAQQLAAGTTSVYRVRIEGAYGPRALRYVVRSDGAPVAYGIPAPTGNAVLAVTDDASVLTGRLTVRAGSGPDAGPTSLTGSTSPGVGNGDLGSRTPGPYAVSRTSYDFGDQAYQPPGLGGRVELRADVRYPTDLTGGPYPLVLFLHGNHAACYRGDRQGYEWPCRDGWTPLPNYEGYDYLSRRLASYGYIVASVSGNGVNVLGNYTADTGMRQRGLLLEKHFDLWNDWNTVGGDPFGTTFVGAVDMTRTGVMGHSRGGEGAVWNALVDQQRATPYGLDAVLALAPVDFTRVTVNDVALGVILPDCDGDVSDLQGVHFFDDSRYASAGDLAPKATVTAFKANHNFFNTVWSPSSGYPGAFDDAYNCPDQLTETAQRRVGVAYIVSFFRRYIGGESVPGEVWTGERIPDLIAPARTAVTYLAPDTASDRLDVARLDRPAELTTNHLGGDVTVTDMGVYGWCSNVYDTPCVPGPYGGVRHPPLLVMVRPGRPGPAGGAVRLVGDGRRWRVGPVRPAGRHPRRLGLRRLRVPHDDEPGLRGELGRRLPGLRHRVGGHDGSPGVARRIRRRQRRLGRAAERRSPIQRTPDHEPDPVPGRRVPRGRPDAHPVGHVPLRPGVQRRDRRVRRSVPATRVGRLSRRSRSSRGGAPARSPCEPRDPRAPVERRCWRVRPRAHPPPRCLRIPRACRAPSR